MGTTKYCPALSITEASSPLGAVLGQVAERKTVVGDRRAMNSLIHLVWLAGEEVMQRTDTDVDEMS